MRERLSSTNSILSSFSCVQSLSSEKEVEIFISELQEYIVVKVKIQQLHDFTAIATLAKH